jgi:hypothetical protein
MRRQKHYPLLEAAIRQHLGNDWTSPRALAERLTIWEVNTVRDALRVMAHRGEFEGRSQVVHSAKTMRLYRAPSHQRSA